MPKYIVRTKIDDGGKIPTKGHSDDAGFDLYAPENLVIREHGMAAVNTHVRMEIPSGCYGRIAPRSSLFRMGAMCDGTIDSGYRGEIGVTIWNLSDNEIILAAGTRIAQLIIQHYADCMLIESESLSETDRGSGGFGSTGK